MNNEHLAKAHLVLVGLPGAGKSTVGAQVARELGRTYMDLDEEIERREGRTISEIFAASGEEYFRKRERSLTEDIVPNQPMVLSPGGGWICDPENVRRMRPPSVLVYLRVSPETALQRMGESAASRPLLNKQDPLGALRRLYSEREKDYMTADLVIDTELIDTKELTDMICDYIRAVEVA